MANTLRNDNDGASVDKTNLKLVIILSGKRKSGKDYISEMILQYVGPKREDKVAVLRIAGPIKRAFASQNELNFGRLLDSSDYKERYRRAMVDWSERFRAKEGWNCFLDQAIREQRSHDRPVWILNDARRLCDLDHFDREAAPYSAVKIIKLRIESSEAVRASRGWKFVAGIDDRDTECGLDNYHNWTLVIENDSNDRESLTKQMEPIYQAVDEALAS